MPLPAAPPGTATIYVRLSRAAGTDNMSRDGMVLDCRALAERHGLTVVSVRVDDGASGAVRDRPEFMRWMDDVRTCRAGAMLTWSTDRLTREGLAVAGIIMDVQGGVDPVTGKVIRQPARLMDCDGMDSADTGGAWRLNFAIKAEVARAELDRIRARNQAARRRADADGRWMGGAAPFGWRVAAKSGGGHELMPEADEKAFMVRVVDDVLGGGTWTAAEGWANRQGLPPRRAERWTASTLRTIVARPRNMVLIGPTRHAAIAALLETTRTGPRGPRSPRRLLTGVLECASCEQFMFVGVSQPNGRAARQIYRCSSKPRGLECERAVTIDAVYTDAEVEARWRHDFGHVRERVAVTVTSEALERARMDHAAALRVIGQRATGESFNALRAAQDRLAALEAEAPVTRWVRGEQTFGAAWDAATVPERTATLAQVAAWARVTPAKRGATRFDPGRIQTEWMVEPGDLD